MPVRIWGSVHTNLRAALHCARRLRGGPVHPDTVDHWIGLVALAKEDPSSGTSFRTRELIKDLQGEIAARGSRDDRNG